MKSFFLFILSTTILVNIATAQNDVNAKKILDAVSNKVKGFKGVTASFSIKSITSKGKPNGTKTGNISYKGKKYILKQGKTEIICDATKIYNFDGSKTITVSSVEEAGQTLSPEIFFTNTYDKEFTYKLVNTTPTTNEIELMPNDKRKNFTKVNVFIDKAKTMVTKAKILDKSNNVIEFNLSNINTTATLADALFIFNKKKYPTNVEILD
jgi:outer membrane lipoprotein carrier protein